MRVIGKKHVLSRNRINSKWAGQDRFLRPWMWKRAFMQLKAERGQNKLAAWRAAWLIWNGPDPLRVVVQGGAATGGWLHSGIHVTRCPPWQLFFIQHTQKLSFMKLNIIIVLIRSHLFTLFRKKKPKKKTKHHPTAIFSNVLIWNVFRGRVSPLNGRRTARITRVFRPWENWSCVETMAVGWWQLCIMQTVQDRKSALMFLSIFATNNNTFLLINHVGGKERHLHLNWPLYLKPPSGCLQKHINQFLRLLKVSQRADESTRITFLELV